MFESEFKGYCDCCNKKIYTFDDPSYNWLDKAGYIIKDKNSNPIVTGGYGSTTMDMSVARFCDYNLHKKYKNILKDKDIIYICDNCITKWIEENKICYILEYQEYDPAEFIIGSKENIKSKYIMKFPEISEKNVFMPIHKNVFAYKFSEGPENIINNMLKYISFIYHYYFIKYISSENRIAIYNSHGKEIKSFGEGSVLVIHSINDFEVISEEEFNKRYEFVF